MQIIGQTKDGWILSASEQEVARLIGYYSKYDNKSGTCIGSEINVNVMYEQLYNLSKLRVHVKAITDAAKVITESVQTKSPVLSPIIDAIIAAQK